MCAHVYMAEFEITMFGIETGIEICICILVPKWVLFWMLERHTPTLQLY